MKASTYWNRLSLNTGIINALQKSLVNLIGIFIDIFINIVKNTSIEFDRIKPNLIAELKDRIIKMEDSI